MTTKTRARRRNLPSPAMDLKFSPGLSFKDFKALLERMRPDLERFTDAEIQTMRVTNDGPDMAVLRSADGAEIAHYPISRS